MEKLIQLELKIFGGNFSEAKELLKNLDTSNREVSKFVFVKSSQIALLESDFEALEKECFGLFEREGVIDSSGRFSEEFNRRVEAKEELSFERRVFEHLSLSKSVLKEKSKISEITKSPISDSLADYLSNFFGRQEKKITPQPQAPAPAKGPKDWDKWAREEEKRQILEKDYDTDPTTHFFKEIFKNCDEDGKRAMMKSFVESNGRALSTNWESEKDKDYKGKDKIPPPEGIIDK